MRDHAPRYSTPEIDAVWSEQNTRNLWYRIWDAVMRGLAPHWPEVGRRGEVEPPSPHKHEVLDELHKYVYQTKKVNAHAGLTSSDVTDNARLIQVHDSIASVSNKLGTLLLKIKLLMLELDDAVCGGYTHWQPAQKLLWKERLGTWHTMLMIPAPLPLGMKGGLGAVGTAVGIRHLGGNEAVRSVKMELEREFNMGAGVPVAMQPSTLAQELDSMAWLAHVSAVLHKIALDVRFLCSTGDIALEFDRSYCGSSAMPKKYNPMEAEKVCGLARLVPECHRAVWDAMANNGMEGTLDRSAPIKETLPRAFGLVAHCLDLMAGIIPRIRVRKLRECGGWAGDSEEALALETKKTANRWESYRKLQGMPGKGEQ